MGGWLRLLCSLGDGSEWTRGTDWPLDKQRLNKQIEQYKKERQKKHDNSQRPKRHDLKAMIANLGAEDDEEMDDTDGRTGYRQQSGRL